MITVCELCGSEKLAGKKCEACLDMTDEEWALMAAEDAYVQGRISVGKLETLVWVALTNPPKQSHPHLIFS